MVDLVPFREDFTFKKQRRKKPAKKIWKQEEIAGADFETKDGFPHILTWTVYRNGKYVDYHTVFGGTVNEPELFLEANGNEEFPPFSPQYFCEIMFHSGLETQGGSKKKGGKQRKRKTPPQLYWYNLQFDASAIIKTLPQNMIERLMLGEDSVYDTETNTLRLDIERRNEGDKKGWVRIDDEDNVHWLEYNRYIRISYLHKKFLQFEPLNYYSNGLRWGKVSCWDVKQFLGGGSLNYQSKKHFNEGKIDFSSAEMGLLGSLSDEGIKFTQDNWNKIILYAEKDANLTARLAWKVVHNFESQGVRMVRPFSPASVAERSAYDLCDIPMMNDMMNNNESTMKAFWTAYQGGWFESTGSGYSPAVNAQDITSAYPHVMWWLPDITKGIWIGTFDGSTFDDLEEYLSQHRLYNPCVIEARVEFPKGHDIYPASKKSKIAGCLMNPRIVYGWFTGDEIVEFQKWGAKIDSLRWSAFIPSNKNDNSKEDVEDGIRYPFRPFVKRFYGMKLHQDNLRDAGSKDYDVEARNLSKLMVNSLYGKNVQAVSRGETKQTGQMWSSVYGAVITAGTRMRMAEIIRLNNYDGVLSVATDGIIFDSSKRDILVPENPKPVFFDGKRINLGDWEDDGKGFLVLMMSGVYSVVKDLKSKNTFRGTYSLFQARKTDEGKILNPQYGLNWYEFCSNYPNESKLERNAENNPTQRPYSIGEAKMKKDYRLVNQFRIVDVSISASGDSNKRKWDVKPQTFGDLLSQWWPSKTWDDMI